MNKISNLFSEKYCIPVSVEQSGDPAKGIVFKITPNEVHYNNSFSIRIIFGWRSIEARLITGDFAGPFLGTLMSSSEQMRLTFLNLFNNLQKSGGKVSLKINNVEQGNLQVNQWQKDDWKNVTFTMLKANIIYDEKNQDEIEELLLSWGGKFLGCFLSLLPVEEQVDSVMEEHPFEGLPEGARIKVIGNRYERSRFNRSACIDFHGAICKVCSFDFKAFYGAIGEGFIHVHHLIPVSQMGGSYVINPISDLVPVCPNCHSMLHANNPPLTIEELKKLIAKE